MIIMKYACRVIECDCQCKECGKVQKFKVHLGCCPEEAGQRAPFGNRCIQCGASLSLNAITEPNAIREIVEKGDEGPAGPIFV